MPCLSTGEEGVRVGNKVNWRSVSRKERNRRGKRDVTSFVNICVCLQLQLQSLAILNFPPWPRRGSAYWLNDYWVDRPEAAGDADLLLSLAAK